MYVSMIQLGGVSFVIKLQTKEESAFKLGWFKGFVYN